MTSIKTQVDKIIDKTLSSYVELDREEAKPAKTYTSSRKTSQWKPAYQRRVTSYDDYVERVPAVQTPSVFTKAEVDAVLLQCRELPTPDKPIKNYAGYSREEWDTLLGVLASYMADVCEGAGLVYKGGMAVGHFKNGLSVLLQESFAHRDPFDKRNRYISVDGRIDTDARKP